jgi:hypothetical protein
MPGRISKKEPIFYPPERDALRGEQRVYLCWYARTQERYQIDRTEELRVQSGCHFRQDVPENGSSFEEVIPSMRKESKNRLSANFSPKRCIRRFGNTAADEREQICQNVSLKRSACAAMHGAKASPPAVQKWRMPF